MNKKRALCNKTTICPRSHLSKDYASAIIDPMEKTQKNFYKATKVVATIGPATETEEILEQLIEAGMNVARFNTKHADPSWHNERIQRVRAVAQKKKLPIGVLLDLQGPEIRIDLPEQKSFKVEQGDFVTFASHESESAKVEENVILVPQSVIDSIPEGNLILLDDGACEFAVTGKNKHHLIAEVLHACEVKHRKTMNTPGVVMDLPSLTDRDYEYLKGVDLTLVDFVGLSFVRNKEDIEVLRKVLAEHNSKAWIVAKIENQSALDNLDELIEHSDAVMVARGDLGVEVEYQKLVFWQKTIINKCRAAAKPVITATQMLKSMVDNPRPTRAEVSDVTHAIYDGTDAVMLSEETTIGHYPIKAVTTQATIAEWNEPFTQLDLPEPRDENSSDNITHAAADLLLFSQQKIDKIICLTQTGTTAQLISRFRPKVPMFVATNQKHMYYKLSLVYGATPFFVEFPEGVLETSADLLQRFKDAGMIKQGEIILLVHGSIWKKPGLTNTLAIIEV